ELHIKKPVSTNPQGVALVVKPGLVRISVQIVILFFASDHQLQLRYDDALRYISIFFKPGLVPLKASRQTADLSSATDSIVTDIDLSPHRRAQKQKENQ